MSRLSTGGRIDRAQVRAFTFDGVTYTGHAGDTLASALLANGVHLAGRSFKYHRPRGILGAGVEEPNALFGVTRGPGRFEPNARATTTALVDGLAVESQNRWPSLQRDAGALNDLASAFIPAGFYYKTFMWPPKAWATIFEPRIRAMAGLGRPTTEADPDRYAQRWAHAETVIVGAGPAGLAAALAAAPSGERIILCDQDEEFGGALLSDPGAVIDGQPAWEWLAAALDRLAAHPNVRLLPRTTAIAYGVGNMVTLAERRTDHLAKPAGAREVQWLVRAGRVVLATGAIERPLVFPNNDRPGIMLASAARTYVNRYAVAPGKRAVVAVDHDSGYGAAFDLAKAMTVAAIVDQRVEVPADLATRAATLGIEVIAGHVVADTRGRLRIDRAGIAPTAATVARPTRWLTCDLLAMAGGWTPSLHLFSQSRGTPTWDDALQAFVPGQSIQAETSAGACRGSFALADCLAQGWAAGGGQGAAPHAEGRTDTGGNVGAPPKYTRGKAFVDFQNDVTAKDIGLAIREGFQSIEHIKRYTTSGMATDQGRTSNLNALSIASQALGRPVAAVGLTTFRAPFTPTTFAGFAAYARGDLFEPVRRTPTHDWAAANGAVFEDVGQWKRARYFAQGAETMEEAVARECRAVRNGVGMFDASTLGKIEVVGPDAAAFMEFMYINAFAKLGVGRCRYGIMLREDGFILDDGVIARVAADRFHVTTTTGGAANVLHIMEDFRQTELPQLKVWLTSTTEQWAVIVVSGRHARAVVAPLVAGIDMDATAFPHMAMREGMICGVPTRLFRVSFSGEMGYEINVPAAHGLAVWQAVHDAGQRHGITPYGTEAMHVLRAEKGFVIVGQETDGTVTPDDAGMAGMIGKAKGDFIGKRSLAREAMRDPERKQLVGLVPVDGATVVEEGAQLVDLLLPPPPAQPEIGEGRGGGLAATADLRLESLPPPQPSPLSASRGGREQKGSSIGHISSSYMSEAVGHPIALALLKRGRSRLGEIVAVAMPAGDIAMRVVSPVFLDPEGVRLDG